MFRKGVLMMLLSALVFSIMSAMVKGLPEVPSYVIVLVRFAVGGVTMAAVFAVGISPMSWNNWAWIVARGISGGTAVVLFFWSIQHIPLSKAVLYGYTYMIFAAILAVPILGERIRPSHWVSIAVAMVGIALLLNVEHLTVRRADLVALLGAFLSGFAVVCITKCRSTDTSANIFWSQCLFGLVIAAWPAAASWIWPTATQWVQLMAIAVLATIAQLMMTYAYKYTGATYGSLLGQLTPVLTALIGILYFKEKPSAGFFVGGVLVLLSCCYLSVKPVGRDGGNGTKNIQPFGRLRAGIQHSTPNDQVTTNEHETAVTSNQ